MAELAVAVAIIAVLLFGALIPFSAQVEIRNVAETRRTMDSIREAMIGFAQANGRLPCPAAGNVAFGSAGAGLEQFNGTNCVATVGVVPWATLGTPETDSWGRRFAYRVSPAFADAIASGGAPLATWNTLGLAGYDITTPAPSAGSPPRIPQGTAAPAPSPANQSPPCHITTAPSQSSIALCTLGDISVFTRSAPSAAMTPLIINVPAVFVSHGRNGFGAWQPNGIQLAFPAGTPLATDDEAANASGMITSNLAGYTTYAFFSRTPTPSASGCGDPLPGPGGTPFCEFDDIVVAIPTNALIARMVAAGKLP